MFKMIMEKVANGVNLTEEEMTLIMNDLMDGKLDEAQIGGFLIGLRMKGETVEEITGAAKVMRDKATAIKVGGDYCVDTCGTGGDMANTFNISTAASIVAAAAGVSVVKHGNRSVSSKSGCADVLEAMGINISMPSQHIIEAIENHGMGFLFAPAFHQSMKYAIGPRKKLGVRTIFNILGPLTNPARVQNQLMGVFDQKYTELLSDVLKNLGVKRAMVVHGLDGLDEITTTTRTKVSFLSEGKINNYYLDPADYGIAYSKAEDLRGGDGQENAKIIKDIFKGEKGPKRDIVVLNSAAVLYVTGKVLDLKEGIKIANQIIDEGLANKKLDELVKHSMGVAI